MIIHVSDALFFRDDIFRVHDLPTDFDKSNTTCVTSGAGTAYLSGAPEVILVFNEVRVVQSLVFFECLIKELGINSNTSSNITYKPTSFDKDEILANHRSFMTSLNIPSGKESEDLPYLYWIPKP